MAGKEKRVIEFPEGFLWGASVSHFQVEGNRSEIDRRLSDWSKWTEEHGKIEDGTNADSACEMASRYKEDIALLEELNLNAFRTSLNWAHLLPEPPTKNGERKFDSEAVKYYKDFLGHLKEKGFKVFLSLFHFCLPEWLAADGGWTNEVTAREFGEFAKLAKEHFNDQVDYWITINEPLVYAYHSYVTGNWPPGNHADYLSAFITVRNLLHGHALAYRELKGDKPVGFSNHCTPFFPEKPWSPLDHMCSYYREQVVNHTFPKSIQAGRLVMPWPFSKQKEIVDLMDEIPYLKGSLDFLGVNYYSRELSRFEFKLPFDIFGSKSEYNQYPVNDLGWEVFPDGLLKVLSKDMKPYLERSDGSKIPVFITENGFCRKFDAQLTDGDWSLNDEDRCNYLISHLVVLKKALDRGVNVNGYIHWSLMDNFEWAEGLCARFGLYRVAFPNQVRTKRKSASIYADIASSNRLEL